MEVTLEQFKEHLKTIDQRGAPNARFFNNGAALLRPNTFSFDFDGYMGVVVRFNEDGTISEWIDCDPSEVQLDKDVTFKHANLEAWMVQSVKTVKDPPPSKVPKRVLLFEHYSDKPCIRAVVFEADEESGAMCVLDILEEEYNGTIDEAFRVGHHLGQLTLRYGAAFSDRHHDVDFGKSTRFDSKCGKIAAHIAAMQAEQTQPEEPSARITINDPGDHQHLPINSKLRWSFDGEKRITITAETMSDGTPVLRIMGSGALQVLPQLSNVVLITTD